MRFVRPILAVVSVLAVTACAEDITDQTRFAELNLAPAFSSLPVGYSEVLNSYAGMEGDVGFGSDHRGMGMGMDARAA